MPYILIILLAPLLLSANFIASSDTNWSYQFDEYSDLGGILEQDIATPAYTIENSTLNILSASLPEWQENHITHPEYFPIPEPEIIVSEQAEVFVTFYSEGASYTNSLGYYTYDGDTSRTRPTTLDNLRQDGIILFANASAQNSGGDLSYGTTVSLGELSPGTKVIFFSVANGWQEDHVSRNDNNDGKIDWIFSSYSPLNKEYDVDSNLTVPNHKHSAILWHNTEDGNILLMGFEDSDRDLEESDNDFNDILFSISTSPLSALTDTEQEQGNGGFAVAVTLPDKDLDGIDNGFDLFPDDPERSLERYYPNAQEYATILFEDSWPEASDFDMNDFVLSFNIREILDANDSVKEIIYRAKVNALGSDKTLGFALQLDTSIKNIESATLNGLPVEVQRDNNNTIIYLFEDATAFNTKLQAMSNVFQGENYIQADTFTLNIVFTTPQKLMAAPYNPFLLIDTPSKGRKVELHLPQHAPTVYADTTLFYTADDTTDLEMPRSYLSKENQAWAILIPTAFAHPIESGSLEQSYKYYQEWVESQGEKHPFWYLYDYSDCYEEPFADPLSIILNEDTNRTLPSYTVDYLGCQ